MNVPAVKANTIEVVNRGVFEIPIPIPTPIGKEIPYIVKVDNTIFHDVFPC